MKNIKNNNIPSRSSGAKLKYIGTKFGNLLVLCRLANKMYECQCDCGNIIKRSTKKLIDGNIQMCNDCGIIYNADSKWKGYGEISGNFWGIVKRGAKSRNIMVNISINQAWELFLKQDRKCALSGIELIFSKINNTASLDRIDSSKPYDITNIQWVHKSVNRIKQNLKQDYFIQWCKLITEYQTDRHSSNTVV